jgi:hypothetical protein
MAGVDTPGGRFARIPAAIAWRGCAVVSTFVSDFAPTAAPVIASASFLAFAAHDRAEAVPVRRTAASPRAAEDERARVAALLRGGLSGA